MRSLAQLTSPRLLSAYRLLREELYMSRLSAVKTPFGFELIGDHAMQQGSFEKEEVEIFTEAMVETDVVLDIGANVGFYTCLARKLGKQVLAFEPLSRNLQLLYANLEANGWNNVEVWPLALGAKSGIMPLYGMRTGASLTEMWSHNPTTWRTPIAVTTLDAIINKRFQDQRLFVKIDIEGSEYHALLGALETLDRAAPTTWLVEITLDLSRSTPNPFFRETFDLFLSRGYQAFSAMGDRQRVTHDDISRWLALGHVPTGCYNWLFISAEAGQSG